MTVKETTPAELTLSRLGYQPGVDTRTLSGDPWLAGETIQRFYGLAYPCRPTGLGVVDWRSEALIWADDAAQMSKDSAHISDEACEGL